MSDQHKWDYVLGEIEALHQATAEGRVALREAWGYVYLMRNEEGLHKIGFSKDPDVRLRTVAAQEGQSVELVCQIPSLDMRALERDLHLQFNHLRVRGEWFYLSEGDTAYLLRLSEGES